MSQTQTQRHSHSTNLMTSISRTKEIDLGSTSERQMRTSIGPPS